MTPLFSFFLSSSLLKKKKKKTLPPFLQLNSTQLNTIPPQLFQADSHPGNVLVLGKTGLARGSGRVALLDYGQSKQLPEKERVAFAELLLAMAPGFRRADDRAVADRLLELGLRFSKDEPLTLKKMAYAMFDTRCSYRVRGDGWGRAGVEGERKRKEAEGREERV